MSFGISVHEPAPDGVFTNAHVFTDLTNTQALGFDHLRHLELEGRVKGSSGFILVHFFHHLGLKNLPLCLFKLDHHTMARSLAPAHQLKRRHGLSLACRSCSVNFSLTCGSTSEAFTFAPDDRL